MVLATGAFTANDACMKIAALALPVTEVLFIRAVFSILLVLAAAAAAGQVRSLGASFRTPVLMRGGVEFLGTVMFVTALVAVPIGTVTAISQLAPIIVTVLGIFVLSEKVGLHTWAAIALGLGGAIMVAGPAGDGFNAYALLAFAVPVLVAVRDLVARNIGSSIGLLPIMLGLLIVMAVGALLASPFGETWRWPGGYLVGLLAIAALLVTIAHAAIVLAIRSAPLSEIAPFYFLQTPWGVLAGILVFGEIPSWTALLGIMFVLGSGLYILHRERVTKRRITPPPLVA